jgi:hypothetical protein
MNVIEVLKEHRQELQSELSNVDKAIAILTGKTRRTSVGHQMTASLRARIGRGVRRAHRRRKAQR